MANNAINIVFENYSGLIKDIKKIERQSEKAVQRTISDFKSRGPGWVSQEVREEYNIKRKDVNEANMGVKRRGRSGIKITGVSVDDMAIVYQGRPLTLTHFGMIPKTIPGLSDNRVTVKLGGVYRRVRTRSPIVVRATIKKGQRELITGKYDTPVFIAQNPRKIGQYLPFQRKGAERTDFESIRTVSVPQMVTNEKVAEDIHKRINEELSKRLQHHLKNLVK